MEVEERFNTPHLLGQAHPHKVTGALHFGARQPGLDVGFPSPTFQQGALLWGASVAVLHSVAMESPKSMPFPACGGVHSGIREC